MLTNEAWLENLYALAYRFESYGVTADLGSMDLMALWGVYCFLKRLSGG